MKKKTDDRTSFYLKTVAGFTGLTVLCSLTAGTNPGQPAKKTNRPNILFICSDQHSYKYAGFAGHPIVQTPNLDRLAQEGTVFTAAYSAAPVCVPGRASLMTGMYPSDVGSYCNSTVWDGSYPVWGTYFRDHGYRTFAFGKLDLDDTLPTGFDTTPSENGHKHNPDITSLFRMPLCYRIDERDQVDGHERNDYSINDRKVTREALEFMTGEAQKPGAPWLLYLGYVQPHPAFAALDTFYEKYYPDNVDMPEVSNEELEGLNMVYQELRHFKRIATPIDREKIKRARSGYYGMITELDESIGKVIRALKETGQYSNTLIIYTSDHGESLGEHGLWLKNNLYDCAIRIPLIISGPGIPANNRFDTPVSQIDLTPTMLDHARIEKPSYLRGKSFDRFFTPGKAGVDNVVYAENHSEGNCTGSFMIRKGDWKYIWFSEYGELLFNLADDPGEKKDLSGSSAYTDVKEEMRRELYSRIDPEKITREAFRKQKAMLDSLAANETQEQLYDLFKGRLGEGQAGILSERLKGEY